MGESTALEALTAELLGDVGVLHDEVKALREALPGTAADVTAKLEVQTGHMLAAAENLRGVLVDMSRQVDAYATEATNKAAEAAKIDIRQAAAQAAGASVKTEVGKEVREVVGFITEAAANLVAQTDQASASIRSASRQVSWSTGKLAGVMGASSFLACLVAVLVLHYAPGWTGLGQPKLTADQQRQIGEGQALDRIWNRLTDKERKHIEELAKEPQ